MDLLRWGALFAGAVALAGCGDETTSPDGGTDAEVAMDAFVPTAVCGDGEVEGDEACDDGNTEGGDGCSADCASDETCGNGVVDPGEVCDDGNTDNGDGCSAGCDSDETCGNSVVDFGVGEVCDDGDTEGGDGCSADCTSDETCGNGVVDPGEECDDGGTEPGDGCDASCMSEACTEAADCDDGNPCNGEETCDGGFCAAGTALDEGAECDADGMAATRDICVRGACMPSTCGDRYVDPGATPAEECDDGNAASGDGCDACTLESCSVASDCDDGNPCTSGHSCADGTCDLGTRRSDGTLCDADGTTATRDICFDGLCVQSACGDGYVDFGATPAEECDDGNTVSGDGCEADCTIPEVPTTAFRITAAELMDPHLYAEVVAGSCNDITNTVNDLIAVNLPNYELNFVGLFQPLDLRQAATPLEVDFVAQCMAGTPLDQCSPRTGASTIATTANNTLPADMTCLTPDASVLSYSAPVNSPGGPCFVSDEQTIMLSLGGVPIELQSARLAATYAGGASPTQLTNGVLVGFLSEEAARTATFDSSLPLVGGDTLYEHLADGGAEGSACTADDTFDQDDSDTFGGENGFWLFLNFEAELVDWVP
jgi:cysteine-rich repeat protein